MKLLRSRLAKVLGGIILIPTVAAGSLSMYVAFRVKTRPPEHMFKPLVDKDGGLLIQDTIIKTPTRWAIFMRIVDLLWIFVPIFVLYVFMQWNSKWYNKWLDLLLRGVERAGPAFVKAGQWTCTRQDLFGPDFRRHFQKLYSEVAVHPFQHTIRIIEEDFNDKAENIFSKIEETTCGSGSIGQVHLAYLKGSDEKVVIKVMHPMIVEVIAQDFYIMNAAARLVDKYFHQFEMYDLPALALAWTNHLAAQLDFRIEAEHLELFRKNFKDVDFVAFPRPIMSTQRVLVESYAPGVPATTEFLHSQEEHVRDILAMKGLNCWCKMLLRDNFIHGDMHPGNILVDTSDPHHPLITMIDVGLCQKISQNESVVTHDLMESFVHWNHAQCSDSIIRMGKAQPFADLEKFKKDMNWLFERWRPAKDSDDQVVTNILQGIFEKIRDNYVAMDPPYVSLLFAVLVLESFIMSLNPDFNMVRHTAPWLISEGHLSKGLVKNVIHAQVDKVKQNYSVVKGRLRDRIFGAAEQSTFTSTVRVSEQPSHA